MCFWSIGAKEDLFKSLFYDFSNHFEHKEHSQKDGKQYIYANIMSYVQLIQDFVLLRLGEHIVLKHVSI